MGIRANPYHVQVNQGPRNSSALFVSRKDTHPMLLIIYFAIMLSLFFTALLTDSY